MPKHTSKRKRVDGTGNNSTISGEHINVTNSPIIDSKVYGNKIRQLYHNTPVPTKPATEVTSDINPATAISNIKTENPKYDVEEYRMNNKRRGKAIIFNHEDYKPERFRRRGTQNDVDRLENILKLLNFETETFKDLGLNGIKAIVEQLSKENYNDCDCIAFFVLAHGTNDKEKGDIIIVKDGYFAVEELWSNFTGKNCPSLAGKPKLFFINACRGNEVEKSIVIPVETDSPNDIKDQFFRIPNHADILLAFSTIKDHVAYRNPLEGSLYIQSFCEVLENYHNSKDLLKMLTITARRVAIDYPKEVKSDLVQMPSFISTLTRDVNFRTT